MRAYIIKNTEKVVKAIAEKHPEEELIKSKDSVLSAHYSCLAYDTFGPFKLVGGINKGRPNEDDLQKAVEFYDEIIE